MITATVEAPNIKLFTMIETATALRVSKSYLSILVRTGKIAGIRQGNRLYFREHDIAKYLVKCTTPN